MPPMLPEFGPAGRNSRVAAAVRPVGIPFPGLAALGRSERLLVISLDERASSADADAVDKDDAAATGGAAYLAQLSFSVATRLNTAASGRWSTRSATK